MEERFETFTSLIAKISRSIRKIKIQEMADYGLRSAQVSCLYYLYMSPSLTAGELGERCEEDKATISRALDYLENNGFLMRECEPARRYRSPIILTEKGIEAGRRISERIAHVLDEIGSALQEDERVAFYQSLKTVSDRLESIVRQF